MRIITVSSSHTESQNHKSVNKPIKSFFFPVNFFLKSFFVVSLFIVLITPSCKEPYYPDIQSTAKVLVVDGFISNINSGNYVRLTIALPYDSTGIAQYVRNATVNISDNTDSIFSFNETTSGYYEPDSLFRAKVNKYYTLYIKTADGYEYVSKPEQLLEPKSPSKVYAGYNKQEKLVTNYYGDVTKEITDVCELYHDYSGVNGITPRFRFTTTQIVEYVIYKEKQDIDFPISVTFNCWITDNDFSLNFTNEKFSSNSADIIKQLICSTTPDRRIWVKDMDMDSLVYLDTLIQAWEYNRIIRVNQYRLNPDAFLFYKGVENQSKAEGKIFDPIVSQLYGNMKCLTDTNKLVLGFFEVSSVKTNSYSIRRNGVGTKITLTNVPNIYPLSYGFVVDSLPDFWIK